METLGSSQNHNSSPGNVSENLGGFDLATAREKLLRVYDLGVRI